MLRNNQYIVIPIFSNLLSEQSTEDPSEDWVLNNIKRLYSEKTGLPFFHFEYELENLLKGLSQHQIKDQYVESVLMLFKSFLEEILEIETSKTTFDLINIKIISSKSNLFYKIYQLLGQYFSENNINSNHKTKVLVSGGINDFDQRLFYENLKYPITRANKLNISISQDTLNFTKLFSEFNYLFLNGHGDNEENGGLLYFYDTHNKFILDGSIIKKNAKNLKVLGILSCGYKPYSKYLNLAEYTILSDNTSTTEYSEMFIKTFNLFYSRTNNVELSLKFGLISILFRSNSEFSFTIYKGDAPLEI